MHKTAGRTELKSYLLENDPRKLPALENKIRAFAAAHDEFEMRIGEAIENLRHEYPREEMRRIWAEAMTTIMPEFDREAARALAAHRDYLKLRARRMAKMKEHEEHEMRLFGLLVDMQSQSQNLGPVISTVNNLRALHRDMKDADEEYITKGRTTTSEERLGLKKQFVERSTEFGKWLKALEDSGALAQNQVLVSEVSHAYTEFVSSALGQDQLFDLCEKEMKTCAKRLDHIADVDVLGQLDSTMARELTVLARRQLSDVQNRTARLVKWTCAVLMIVSAGVILACWAVMNVVSKRIVKPILALSDASKALAKGDLIKKVEVSANDEIGDLCAAFNEMADDLRETTTSVSHLQKAIVERRRVEVQLRRSIEDLEQFNKLAVERELRMVELKKEVDGLLAELGRQEKYRLGFEKLQDKLSRGNGDLIPATATSTGTT
ncbi:MAG: HAMP domain-containing protein [Phycisphaerales bacterium]|nr:MAG: HAMP domain-containing protein [Phycisphaerales bacterium]